MNKKFSLSGLMHNDKLMIIISLVLSIILWAVITNSVGSESTRDITVTVPIELTNAVAQEKNLRIIWSDMDAPQIKVSVTVKGRLWLLSTLKEDELDVSVDTSGITSSGTQKVNVIVKQPASHEFEIVSHTPTEVSVECDTWVGPTEYPVTPEIDGLSVPDEEKYRLGTPSVDTTTLPDGKITIEGPQKVMDRISRVVAKVDNKESLSDIKVFRDVPIVAYAENGSEISLAQCKLSAQSVAVTVPVLEYRKVNFTYQLENAPAGLTKREDFITLSPSSIDVWGPPELLDQFVESVENLGTVDFDNLKPEASSRVFPLNIPSYIKVDEGPVAVEMNFNMKNIKTTNDPFTLSLSTAAGSANLTILNRPEGKEISIPQLTISNIILYGPASSINKITAANLMVTVDMQGNSTPGPTEYEARITVKKQPVWVDSDEIYDDIWVYYGDEPADGYKLYVTVK